MTKKSTAKTGMQAGVCRLYPSDAPCPGARAGQGGPQGQGYLPDAQQPQGHHALHLPLLVPVEWQHCPAGSDISMCHVQEQQGMSSALAYMCYSMD